MPRNGFQNIFKLGKDTKSDLFYCSKKQRYFLLGHFIPTKGCCEMIKKFELNNPIKDILIKNLNL